MISLVPRLIWREDIGANLKELPMAKVKTTEQQDK